MRFHNVVFRATVVVAVLVFASSASAQQPDDPFAGWLAAAKESFETWQTEHTRLDGDFLHRLRARVVAQNPEQIALAGFCTPSIPDNVQTLRGLMDKQLAAQSTYQSEHRKEANKQLEAGDLSTEDAKDRELQRVKDLGEANELLQFYVSQRTELVRPGAGGSGVDSDPNLKSALTRLESQIQRQHDAVDTLTQGKVYNEERSESLKRQRLATKQKIEDADESLGMLGVMKRFWESFYLMRRAQYDEYCPRPGPVKIMVPKVGEVK